jgi:hypothetical protein
VVWVRVRITLRASANDFYSWPQMQMQLEWVYGYDLCDATHQRAEPCVACVRVRDALKAHPSCLLSGADASERQNLVWACVRERDALRAHCS